MTACLPRLDHLRREDFHFVYEPSDDTYLLCDALHHDLPSLLSSPPLVCCEVGTGSGAVLTYLQLLLREHHRLALYLATDLNPKACRVAARTARYNHCSVDVIHTTFTDGILDNQVDVLIFNPPYVPTPDEEVSGSGIEVSWAGGAQGRVVIDRFLSRIERILSHRGVLYLVLVKENKPSEVRRLLSLKGLDTEILLRRRASNEELLVLKAWRQIDRR